MNNKDYYELINRYNVLSKDAIISKNLEKLLTDYNVDFKEIIKYIINNKEELEWNLMLKI